MSTPPLLMRREDAAEALGISLPSLYRLIRSGQLPTVHIGRSCRIPREALEDLVTKLTADATSA